MDKIEGFERDFGLLLRNNAMNFSIFCMEVVLVILTLYGEPMILSLDKKTATKWWLYLIINPITLDPKSTVMALKTLDAFLHRFLKSKSKKNPWKLTA